eukprot:gene21327-26133_t
MRREGSATADYDDSGWIVPPSEGGAAIFAQSAVAAAAAAAIAVVVHESSQHGSESNSQANDNLDNPAVSKCPVCFRAAYSDRERVEISGDAHEGKGTCGLCCSSRGEGGNLQSPGVVE